jgi:hypothetical protein
MSSSDGRVPFLSRAVLGVVWPVSLRQRAPFDQLFGSFFLVFSCFLKYTYENNVFANVWRQINLAHA